jgi:putative nucleotidyltransferase with HDIG domain
LNLIYRVSGGMKVNRSPGEFFKQVCLDLMDVIEVRGTGVMLRTESIEHREPVLYGSTSLPPGAVHRLSDQLVRHLETRKSAIVINNLSQDPAYSWISANAQQLLAVPLQRDEQVLGCLFAFDKSEGDFDSVDAKLLTSIANESAIYLQNAILFEDVRGLMMGLLHSMVSAVDAKDAYTCGHSERVALVARELAQIAGLPAATVERVYMAGLLHDVGKIGVPESVLQKPGKLTNEEFDLMKQHPEIGARILRDVKQLEDILPGVLHHHERWDGRGYPAKLVGENIPLMGRIICLADCFDAMTSNRTYRRALPFEVAMVEIRNGAGTQFDPALADAFIAIGEKRLRDLTAGHHEQASRLIAMHSSLRVA